MYCFIIIPMHKMFICHSNEVIASYFIVYTYCDALPLRFTFTYTSVGVTHCELESEASCFNWTIDLGRLNKLPLVEHSVCAWSNLSNE